MTSIERGRPLGPRVWIAAEFHRAYGRDLLEGVWAYLRDHGPWEVYVERSRFYASADRLDQFPPLDGIITENSRRSLRDLDGLIERGLKVVCVEVIDDRPDIPQVVPSDRHIGRVAGRYLRDLALPHYAYVGLANVRFSDERLETYRAVLAKAGHEPLVAGHNPYATDDQLEKTGTWLESLPKPCGVFCLNTMAATALLRACAMRRIRVPEDVAVLAVGNDEYFCRLCSPPLSAIDHNTARVGYEAAALLDRLMAGDPPPDDRVWVLPKGVVERQSTNVLATRNPYVARAVRFILERADRGIGVADVVRAARCPRRTLEQAFRRHLDRGIRAEIVRRQIARARELLAETHLAMPDVAERSGFSSAARLSQVFRRECGMPPSEYRRRRTV